MCANQVSQKAKAFNDSLAADCHPTCSQVSSYPGRTDFTFHMHNQQGHGPGIIPEQEIKQQQKRANFD
jgi:hypothetical protein